MTFLNALLAAGAVALAGAAPARHAVVAPDADVTTITVVAPRAPRAAQDSAELVYRAGRDAISRGDYKRASELFERVIDRWKGNSYAVNAMYWRAFALYRAGGTSELRQARRSLAALRDTGSDAYRSDATSLDTRICGELARRGDAACAATVEIRADSAGLGAAIGEVVRAATSVAADAARMATDAAASAMRDPEVQSALIEAQAAARSGVAEGVRAATDAMRDAARDISRESARAGRSSRSRSSECEADDDDMKVVALDALQQMDAERAMPLLRKVMASREKCSEVLRKKAVFLIARKNTTESADMLVAAARNDPDVEVRKEAVFWLSRVSGEKSAQFLRDVALGSGDVEVRKQAVFSLSQSNTPAARATLRQIAESGSIDAEVRGEAIQWLGMRGTGEDADFLRGLYPRLTDRETKDKVLYAMSRQKGNAAWLIEVAQNPKEPMELRNQALFWAGRSGASAEQLVSLYDRTTDRDFKKQLVFVYQQRGAGATFYKLLDIGRNEKDVEVRKDAIFWLSRSKDPRALKLLEDLISK